jgi:DNA-directed RNA polymerase specialized sigma24 family protein
MANRSVFDDFVLARSQALVRSAYLLTQDESLAEDLVQTALTKAWFAWGHIEDPEAYVRRIMVTTSASWWRRKWVREMPTEEFLLELDAATADHGAVDRPDLWGPRSATCPVVSGPSWSCATSRTVPRSRPRS